MSTIRRQGSSSRLPFRPRDVNSASTASLVSSKGSGGSRGSSSMASKYLNSYLETSNNPNNQRMSSMSASASLSERFGSLRVGSASEDDKPAPIANENEKQYQDASTVSHAGAGLKTTSAPLLSEGEKFRSENTTTSTGAATGSSKSKHATAPAPAPASVPTSRKSSSSRLKPKITPEDHEEMEIVEHRKKASGEGYTVHRYIRGRLLGKGGFAKVYWCTSLDTNRHYAVKIVPKANLVKSRARQKLQAEIKIHRSLKHSHVCEYKHFFEDKVNCYILLELCQNQSMNEMIKRRKRLTEPEVKYFMKQLLEAVQYMHEINVIHRDLKLGNLFLDKNLNVKVGDFGLATRLSSPEEKRKTICGTPNYIAPEVIDGNKEKRGHSFEVDIWSMGVICFTTLVGKPPYESKDVKSTYQRILANQYEFPSHIPISGHARELISAMLQTNPRKRPSLAEIAVHPFFTHDIAKIPTSIPLSGTHVAPDWQEDTNGNIYAVEKESDEKYRLPTISSRKRSDLKKTSSSSSSGRNPLTSKDANADGGSAGGPESKGIVRTNHAKVPLKRQPKFNIFDDEAAVREKKATAPVLEERQQYDKAHGVDQISNYQTDVRLSTSPSFPETEARSTTTLPHPVSSITDKDMQALEAMHNRLRDAFDGAESGFGLEVEPQCDTIRGTDKWVTRYVDYTSKYGLGFLLNDGSAGVYFNDSTKSVLAPAGEAFLYVERRKVANTNEHAHELHTLTSYPETLQKKVTLLKHFRNYLVEQQKKAEDEDGNEEANGSESASPAAEIVDSQHSKAMIYLKKWVRTKHAILFRLSNGTVQVVFYDHTEVLLSEEGRVVTYVDKKRQRSDYSLNEVVMGSSVEIGKRLKYARDIIKQLIPK